MLSIFLVLKLYGLNAENFQILCLLLLLIFCKQSFLRNVFLTLNNKKGKYQDILCT